MKKSPKSDTVVATHSLQNDPDENTFHGRGVGVSTAGTGTSSFIAIAAFRDGLRRSGRCGRPSPARSAREDRSASARSRPGRPLHACVCAAPRGDARTPQGRDRLPSGSCKDLLLVAVDTPQGFVDIDLAPGNLLHQLGPARCGGGWAVDADLGQQRVESRACGRVADPEVPLELLHVSSRGEEDTQDVAVLVGQHTELARGKATGELCIARRAAEPWQRETFVAGGAVERWAAASVFGHQSAETLTLPIVQSMERLAAPDPTVTSRAERPPPPSSAPSPSMATLPSVVWAVMRTLEPFSRLILTCPISHRTLLDPLSRRPLAVTFPACTTRVKVPPESETLKLPACTSPVIGPCTPSTRTLPACTSAVRARAGFIRTVRLRRAIVVPLRTIRDRDAP